MKRKIPRPNRNRPSGFRLQSLLFIVMAMSFATEMPAHRALGRGLENVCNTTEIDDRLMKCKAPPLVILVKHDGQESLAPPVTFLGATAVPAAKAAMSVLQECLLEFNAYDEVPQQIEGEGEGEGDHDDRHASLDANGLKNVLSTGGVGVSFSSPDQACELLYSLYLLPAGTGGCGRCSGDGGETWY